MKIEKKLEELLHYYMSSRGVGHTDLMKKGTDNYDKPFFVLTHNAEGGDVIGLKPTEVVSLLNLERLRGASRPLVIDNRAMIELLIEAIMRIDTLTEENKKLVKQNKLIIVRKSK